MNFHFRIFILPICLFWAHCIASSILSGTLIKTPNGLVSVESIPTADILIGCTKDNRLVNVAVTDIASEIVDEVIVIQMNNGELCASFDQLFYDSSQNNWIAAQNIQTGGYLLDRDFCEQLCLSVKRVVVAPMKAYKISTTYPHNFFVFEQGLLTHNFIPFIGLGATFLFGGGAIEFGGLSLIASIASVVFGVNLFKKHAKSGGSFYVEPQINSYNCGGNGKEPKKDDDDQKKERKHNNVNKATFFKKIKGQYRHWRNGRYIRKSGEKGLGKKAEYLQWDHLHDDVEAFDQWGDHIGSYDPESLQLYKPAKPMYNIKVR